MLKSSHYLRLRVAFGLVACGLGYLALEMLGKSKTHNYGFMLFWGL
jgi:hypothetical protein